MEVGAIRYSLQGSWKGEGLGLSFNSNYSLTALLVAPQCGCNTPCTLRSSKVEACKD